MAKGPAGVGEEPGGGFVEAEVVLGEVIGAGVERFEGGDAFGVGEFGGIEAPVYLGVLAAAGEEVVVVNQRGGAAAGFAVAGPDHALGGDAAGEAVVVPVVFERAEGVAFAVEEGVEVADDGEDEGAGAVADEDGVGAAAAQEFAAAPVHLVEFDEAVIDFAGMAVLAPEGAVGVGEVVVEVDAVHGEAVEHAVEGGEAVFGEAVGGGEAGGEQVAIGVHGGGVAAAVVEALPEIPLASGLHVLNAGRAGVHEVGVLGPEEEHSQLMDLVEDALELVGRGARFAGGAEAVHLEEGEAHLGDVGDLPVGRVGMLLVADPDEHAQVMEPRMRQAAGGDADADPEGERLAGFEDEGFVAGGDVDQVLREGNLGLGAVPAADFGEGGVELGLAQVERAAVGEDREGGRRAEDLQAGGERVQADRLAGGGQGAARGSVAVLVAGLVEVVAELALRGKAVEEGPLDAEVGPRGEGERGDNDPVVEEGVVEGVVQVGAAFGGVAEGACDTEDDLVLAFAVEDQFAGVEIGNEAVTVIKLEVGGGDGR